MDTKTVIKKLLEADKSNSLKDLLNLGFRHGGSEFFMLEGDLREYFRKEFDEYWSYFDINFDLEQLYQSMLKISKAQAKNANREVSFNLFRNAFYGRLYEFAKGNLRDEEIEKMLNYDNTTGYWRLTQRTEVLDGLAMNLFIPGYTAIAIFAPEKRKANEEYKNIMKQYKDQIYYSELQNNKIKNLRKLVNKVRNDAKKPTAKDLAKIANETKKKNGKLNYKKIGETLGVSNHTAKNWCNDFNIK